jgi:rhodanese-related sulfurtransferase
MPLFDSPAAHPNPAGYKDVSPQDVPLPADGVRVVDVREPHEFVGELGHVPGSELVPMHSVLAHAMAWDREAPLLLVCRSGGRSGMVAQALIRAGFTRVMNLAGGMLAWNAAGLAVEW